MSALIDMRGFRDDGIWRLRSKDDMTFTVQVSNDDRQDQVITVRKMDEHGVETTRPERVPFYSALNAALLNKEVTLRHRCVLSNELSCSYQVHNGDDCHKGTWYEVIEGDLRRRWVPFGWNQTDVKSDKDFSGASKDIYLEPKEANPDIADFGLTDIHLSYLDDGLRIRIPYDGWDWMKGGPTKFLATLQWYERQEQHSLLHSIGAMIGVV